MPEPSVELLACIQDLSSILEARIRLIDALIGVLIQEPTVSSLRSEQTEIPDSVAGVLPLMIQGLGSSSATLRRLSDSPGLQTRDCFAVARGIVELGVNVCYIIAIGPDAAERAQRHSRQKAYRDTSRQSAIGANVIKLEFSGRPDASEIAGLEEELAEFSSKAGHEKQHWVDLSIDDRIAAVGAALGDRVLVSLQFPRFMIYRHSSEILHGTFFGVMYCFGLTPPGTRNEADAAGFVAQQHMMILMAANLVLAAVVLAFHERYGFGWAEGESERLQRQTASLDYLRRKD